jgi:hypothetical protein
MNPLSDDELNSLLEQAKHHGPAPGPGLTVRALHAFEATKVRRTRWRWLAAPVRIPWPVAILAATLLVCIGVMAGHGLRQTAGADQRIAYHRLTFKEFQPVREIRPRVWRSVRSDQ